MESALIKKNNAPRITIQGSKISSGQSIGRLYKYDDFISREIEYYSIGEEEVKKEINRIISAMKEVYTKLDQISKDENLDKTQLDIINTHKLFLKDETIIDEIKHEMQEKKINSESLIKYFFRDLENRFESLDTPQFKSKSKDMADIGNKILKELLNIKSHQLEDIPENSIIFAKRILPTDLIHIDSKKLKGIISTEGSKYSHAGIMAKELKIPFISHVKDIDNSIPSGTEILIDGDKAKVIINPSKEDKNNLNRIELTNNANTYDTRFEKAIPLSINNEQIKISTNVNNKEDIQLIQKYKPEEIGLFRLEYFYLRQSKKPDQNELYKMLDNLFQPVKNLPINLRLLDIGGDKTLPYLENHKTQFSKMGLIGIRYLFHHKELLQDQLYAYLQLRKKYDIRLLLPRITLPEEIINLKNMLQQINKENLPVKIGSMIEIPSACFLLDEILEHVDFISIGSNDLIQYYFACDRENDDISDYFQKGNKIIIEIIQKIVKKASMKNIPCTLCGELASENKYTKMLLDIGLRNFSVVPGMIPVIRKQINSLIHS